MPNATLQKKLVIDTLIVDGIIFALLSIFFFFDLKQIPLGFLLGSVISILCHLILCFQANIITNPDLSAAKAMIPTFCYLLRFVLYGGGLLVAFLLQYYGHNIFAWYSVFIAYMIIKLVIIIRYSKYRKPFKELKEGGKK